MCSFDYYVQWFIFLLTSISCGVCVLSGLQSRMANGILRGGSHLLLRCSLLRGDGSGRGPAVGGQRRTRHHHHHHRHHHHRRHHHSGAPERGDTERLYFVGHSGDLGGREGFGECKGGRERGNGREDAPVFPRRRC